MGHYITVVDGLETSILANLTSLLPEPLRITFMFSLSSGKKEKIIWGIDGEPWQTQQKWYSEKAPFPAPFNQRFHLVLNLAVGETGLVPPMRRPNFPPGCSSTM